MNNLITLLLLSILPFICAPSCELAPAQEVKPVQSPAIPVEAAQPSNPGKSHLSHEDEMRVGQVLLIINQLCTEDGNINLECCDVVGKCFGDKWQPTVKIVTCYMEWKGKP